MLEKAVEWVWYPVAPVCAVKGALKTPPVPENGKTCRKFKLLSLNFVRNGKDA